MRKLFASCYARFLRSSMFRMQTRVFKVVLNDIPYLTFSMWLVILISPRGFQRWSFLTSLRHILVTELFRHVWKFPLILRSVQLFILSSWLADFSTSNFFRPLYYDYHSRSLLFAGGQNTYICILSTPLKLFLHEPSSFSIAICKVLQVGINECALLRYHNQYSA